MILYVKSEKFGHPKENSVIILKFYQCGLPRVMRPKDADGIANSVDPDQTAS